jgi:hypothetical protein
MFGFCLVSAIVMAVVIPVTLIIVQSSNAAERDRQSRYDHAQEVIDRGRKTYEKLVDREGLRSPYRSGADKELTASEIVRRDLKADWQNEDTDTRCARIYARQLDGLRPRLDGSFRD